MKSLSALAVAVLVRALNCSQGATKTDTQRVVNAVCETESWQLVDTLVSLPVLGEDALRASSFPVLRRVSPEIGNLSVSSTLEPEDP